MAHASQLLTLGAMAPLFTLPSPTGKPQTLAELLAKGPVLLAFHRGTW